MDIPHRHARSFSLSPASTPASSPPSLSASSEDVNRKLLRAVVSHNQEEVRNLFRQASPNPNAPVYAHPLSNFAGTLRPFSFCWIFFTTHSWYVGPVHRPFLIWPIWSVLPPGSSQHHHHFYRVWVQHLLPHFTILFCCSNKHLFFFFSTKQNQSAKDKTVRARQFSWCNYLLIPL